MGNAWSKALRIAVIVGLVGAFVAPPAGAALPNTADPGLHLDRLIETAPFVGSSVSVRDNEGSAYVPADNSLWIVSDNDDEAFEINPTTGALRRVVAQSAFANAPRLGGGGSAGNGRTEDFEAVAYDAAADALIMFSGVTSSEPTAFRLLRDSGGMFQVESWQPLSSSTDFTAAGWRATDGRLYVARNNVFYEYDYATNAVGSGFTVSGVTKPLGIEFDAGGDLIAVTADEHLLRADFDARVVRPGWDLDLAPFGVLDSRGVALIGDQIFVSDGYDYRASSDPNEHAVFVFDVTGDSGPSAPVAGFSSSATSGVAPLAVTFTDTSSGGPESWSWDFGDGTGSSATSPSHTFTASGSYPVSLTVTNGSGSDTASTVITVSEAPVGSTIETIGDAYVSLSSPTKNYGTYTDLKLLGPNGPHEYRPYFQFAVTGVTAPPVAAVLRVYVTDAGPSGGSWHRVADAWSESTVNWSNAPGLTGSPIATVGPVSAGQWIEIDVTNQITGNGTYSFAASSTATNTVKLSSREGSFPAQLVIDAGDPGPTPPVAGFSTSATSGVAPLDVTFTDTSSGGPEAWSWDFGDGTGSSAASPSHTFTAAGNYTVALTVANGLGSDAASTVISVSAPPEPPVVSTIETIGDAYVSLSSPTKIYGTYPDLKLLGPKGQYEYRPYFQFAVAGVTAPPVSAVLRVYVTDAGPSGGSWYRVGDTWSETTVNWSNAPALTGSPLTTVGPVAAGRWIEIDVTDQITGNGTYSFAASSVATNTVKLASREGSFPAQLVITRAP